MMNKRSTMTLIRRIGEPVRVSSETLLTVVSVRNDYVRLRLSAPEIAFEPTPLLVDHTRKRVEIPLGTPLVEAERVLVEATLQACRGSKSRAAIALGCSLKTLYNKLHRYAQEDAAGKKRAGAGVERSSHR